MPRCHGANASPPPVPRIYLSPPDVGDLDRKMLLEAFDSGWIAPNGPDVDAFELEFASCVGAAHAVALSSGTAALHLALDVLGVGPGDDVLVSDLTFVATANAVLYRGARPTFIDSDEASWNLDPDLLAEEMGRRAARGRLPAAVIVVDIYGQCADYDRILPVCREHGVPVIEDAAEALGATFGADNAGALGDLGAFSFNGNKIITTSGGGMLVGDDEASIARARYLSTQAREPAPHYEHQVMGYNYRLSNLLAGLGRAQVATLEQRVETRRRTNERYREALGRVPGIDFMPEAAYGRPTHWLTVVTVDPARFGATAEDVRVHLQALGIESRPAWKPMHLQPLFAAAPTLGGAVSERLFRTGLCLPSGSNLSANDLALVVDAMKTTPHG
ncbi:MAG: aminotransferase class I/II-fold pyridoxal phosphate-dependent enzyme [Acidimicrobiia bacterium]|nr:aminotransferase class I/II-fold pyridoxal phosphate-dependent enzyme [Acidimicrobiia bacterium]